jgi:outer membrane protein assembly factor BamB
VKGKIAMRIFDLAVIVLLFSSALHAQTLKWEERRDFAGFNDSASAIAVHGQTVVVAGSAQMKKGGVVDGVAVTSVVDLAIRAYDAQTGTVSWSDQIVDANPPATGNGVMALSAERGSVYWAAMKRGITPVDSSDILVRAYSSDGDLLWDDLWHMGNDDQPKAIAANANFVVVVGAASRRLNGPLNYVIRTYDADTGDVLWEDHLDQDSVAWKVNLAHGHVLAMGTISSQTDVPQTTTVVRDYRPRNGRLRWDKRFGDAFSFDMAVQAGRAYIGGQSSNGGFLVAIDVSTGALVWKSGSDAQSWRNVAVEGPVIVVAGQPVGSRGLLVRAYGLGGRVLWQSQTMPAQGFADSVAALAVTDEAVFVGGQSGKDFEFSESLLRVYDLYGTLIKEERFDRSMNSGINGLATNRKGLFTIGSVSVGPELNRNWVVRGYLSHERRDRNLGAETRKW